MATSRKQTATVKATKPTADGPRQLLMQSLKSSGRRLGFGGYGGLFVYSKGNRQKASRSRRQRNSIRDYLGRLRIIWAGAVSWAKPGDACHLRQARLSRQDRSASWLFAGVTCTSWRYLTASTQARQGFVSRATIQPISRGQPPVRGELHAGNAGL